MILLAVLTALFMAALAGYCTDVVQRSNYRDAKARFAARFCSHGIVATGWCEECEKDKTQS